MSRNMSRGSWGLNLQPGLRSVRAEPLPPPRAPSRQDKEKKETENRHAFREAGPLGPRDMASHWQPAGWVRTYSTCFSGRKRKYRKPTTSICL
jgi:hypothetical protein